MSKVRDILVSDIDNQIVDLMPTRTYAGPAGTGPSSHRLADDFSLHGDQRSLMMRSPSPTVTTDSDDDHDEVDSNSELY